MAEQDLGDQLLTAWQRNQEILDLLLEAIPPEGWTAKPTGSRGRDVARVFAHLHRVRLGWLHAHRTGQRAKLPRVHKGPPPPQEAVRRDLAESGAEVESWLREALVAKPKMKLFGGQPLRFATYLISHESHHRGQVALAVKQAGIRLPEKVAIGGLWGRWIFGK